ncbi:MAG TPA: NADH-quinone oxidoreductase subunit C [Bradyrhizobium sp.]|nr:NADH-quinone oxidoreductase subunit C [Bradyrhizobium sp.]
MLIDRIPGQRIEGHKPAPRVAVSAETWRMLSAELAAGRMTLFGLWGDADKVHMALLQDAEIVVVTIECEDGKFPSVGQVHPPAIRLERAIQDLCGSESIGLRDQRPWLDHGRWGVKHPLATRVDANSTSTRYQFLPSEGESLHQIAVGPVHAGIIEPGHFRFTVNGETVVRLEQRLGYVHKGIESLMAGASIEKASRLAGRVSGDSTVAYALAFANAVEAAAEAQVPPRAAFLRALMAELERLANHFGDIGAICNDASFVLMHAQTGILRERCLRAAEVCFGHRLMMDRIIPGGLARDIAPEGPAQLRALIAEIRRVFPKLVELYDNTASLQDRTVSTGFAQPSLVRQYGAGGYVGRASGRAFDARHDLKYPPYDQLSFEIPVLDAGDVDARVWIRIREVDQSMSLIEQILDRLPGGQVGISLNPAGEREGFGVTEAFRGDVLVWVRLQGGRIERCHLRDPSWFQWPLLEAAIENNIVADFPLCNKSFNCSYSGHDL